jgi:hypothetical protein
MNHSPAVSNKLIPFDTTKLKTSCNLSSIFSSYPQRSRFPKAQVPIPIGETFKGPKETFKEGEGFYDRHRCGAVMIKSITFKPFQQPRPVQTKRSHNRGSSANQHFCFDCCLVDTNGQAAVPSQTLQITILLIRMFFYLKPTQKATAYL